MPFIPSIGVFPEYAVDDGPLRFFEEICAAEAERVSAFTSLLGIAPPTNGEFAAHLDAIGAQLAEAITPAPGMVRGENLAKPHVLSELLVAPIWNAIAIDLAVYLAHILKAAFPEIVNRHAKVTPILG